MASLTGPASEIIENLKAMEEAGLDSIAIQVPTNGAPEMIKEIGEQVIARN